MTNPDNQISNTLKGYFAPEAVQQVMARLAGATGKNPELPTGGLKGHERASAILTVAAKHVRACCSRR